jgi:hypothetical protein
MADATWTYAMNDATMDLTSATTQAQSTLYKLKTYILTAGWTVVSSSNSVSQGASDYWTTAAGLVRGATTGTARSWILLASPVGLVAGADGSYTGAQSQMWMVIDYVGASIYSANIGFYSLLPTGGSISAIPTTTAGHFITSATGLYTTTYTTAKINFAYTSTGGWYFMTTQPGNASVITFVCCLPLADPAVYGAITYPYAIITSFTLPATSPLISNIFTAIAGSTLWNTDGTIDASLPVATYTPVSNWASSTDINGNIPTIPFYVTNTGASKAIVGRIPDFAYTCATSMPSGFVVPGTGTPTQSSIVNMLFPSNVSIIS